MNKTKDLNAWKETNIAQGKALPRGDHMLPNPLPGRSLSDNDALSWNGLRSLGKKETTLLLPARALPPQMAKKEKLLTEQNHAVTPLEDLLRWLDEDSLQAKDINLIITLAAQLLPIMTIPLLEDPRKVTRRTLAVP
ncbi:hypothetical protein L195_g045880 [Trifolium pratense]|uniref:Uncharacterized protein n=1 Tax=Trifolium pratense TaxID=57577 RepID=A0A2K3MG44_TRIPR|nr:hypothetical protein L195_g045880 [Trifolium pratense]